MRTLNPLTLDAIVLSVASALGATGCGIPLDGYDPLPCDDEGGVAWLGDLSLEEPADYVALRERAFWDTGGAWETTQSEGEPCASATDGGACEAALEAASAESGFQLGECIDACDETILVVNRGDEVQIASDADSVRAALGTVDTPGEAALSVSLGGYRLSCDRVEYGGVRAAADGYEVIATAYQSTCAPIVVKRYQLGVGADGAISVLDEEVASRSQACIGRRPGGLRSRGCRGRGRTGAWLAGIAHLEAASVHAFAELEADLARHGAPAELRAQAARARRDEIRHARQMARLARRHDGVVTPPVVRPSPPCDLEALALENAVEGCVRETYGALFGAWQARFAEDPAVRATMRRVAEDEARHAALSWALARWLEPRLSPEARARVLAAREEALATLRAEMEAPLDPETARVVGAPPPEAQRALVARLSAELGLGLG